MGMELINEEQLANFKDIIIEDFGNHLDHEEFIDVALQLFEDIAGFELANQNEVVNLIERLWSNYHEKT
jgi:hypothetical protein